MAFDLPPEAPSEADIPNFANEASAFIQWMKEFGTDLALNWDTIENLQDLLDQIEGLATAYGTSTTSNTIADTGDVTFTTQTGKGFLPGMYLRAARTSAAPTTWMSGICKSYNSGTGALVITMDYKVGSGSGITDWTISPAARNSLPPASASNVWIGTSDALSLTPKAFADVTALKALTDAATIATDAATGVNFSVVLGGNRTMGQPTNLIDGRTYAWCLIQDATGSRTLGWHSIFDWGDAGAPTLSTAAGKADWAYGQYSAGLGKLIMSFRRSA